MRLSRTEHEGVLALTWAALAIFVLAVYLSIVVGGGRLLGRGDAQPDVLLSVLATCVVALAFEPVRVRLSALARELLRGERASPYDALSRLSAQASEAYGLEEVLPRMAHVLADGTGARKAEVWLASGPGLRCAAQWPDTADPAARLEVTAEGVLVADPPAAAVVPVRHSGALLGALVVRRDDGRLTPVERTLLSDLAAQAGLVLENVALTSELAEKVRLIGVRSEQLATSRARLVATQTAQRRRLERDIHDGAQQHLVALAVNLSLVQTLLSRSPERAAALLGGLGTATLAAERTLLDLARGVFPRTLTEDGLLAALREAARTAPVPVVVDGEAPRYAEEVEVAAYFCCLEAVQNAVKHARASTIHVALAGDAATLEFTVSDDGLGFDPAGTPRGTGLDSIADRLGTLGGSLAVDSRPGSGTVMTGRVSLLETVPR